VSHRRFARVLRPLGLLAVVLAAGLGVVAAQTPVDAWTVQTVALRDLREARAAAAELRTLGLDGYTEFAMSQGKQYVRVRLGCFQDRETADAMARVLRGRVTKEAVSVQLTLGAPVRGCVERQVGFIKPSRWQPDGAGVGDFHVEVAGQRARVVYAGTRWAVLQANDLSPARSWPVRLRARQTKLAGRPAVAVELDAGSVVLCPGTLLGVVGDAAIVEEEASVVACRWRSIGGAVAGMATP